MYHVKEEVNDRGKKMADRYLETMTLKAGHVRIQAKQEQLVYDIC